MAKSKTLLDPLFKFKPEHYLVIIVLLALFLFFRPDCTLREGQENTGGDSGQQMYGNGNGNGAQKAGDERVSSLLDILKLIGKEGQVSACFVDKEKVFAKGVGDGHFDDHTAAELQKMRHQHLLDCMDVPRGSGLSEAIGTGAGDSAVEMLLRNLKTGGGGGRRTR